jgi:cold shock protein
VIFFGISIMSKFRRAGGHYTRRKAHFPLHRDVHGTVKWEDSKREFGFVATESFGDVLLHMKTVKAGGYSSLAEGQRVVVNIRQSDSTPAAGRYKAEQLVGVFPMVLSTATRKTQSPERPRPEQAVAKLGGQNRDGSEPTTSG